MLKMTIIRSEVKEVLILMTFACLLIETLTPATVLFAIVGGILVMLKLNPGVMFRHIVALSLFIVYWFTYGKLIDPEVGLNFLTSIMVVKLLEKESLRDRYMVFFGILLLVSAGALFQKSLLYLFFFCVSFFVLIQDFYKNLNLPSKLQNIFRSILWILPFTAIFFVFAPRIISPFQIDKGEPAKGEVGYTPDVSLSDIESISFNDQVVFQAVMSSVPFGERLYWRGNTITFSDGWNWNVMPQDRPGPQFEKREFKTDKLIHQKIKVFSQQPYFFGLDHPSFIVTSAGAQKTNETRSLLQNRWQNHARYEVWSEPGSIVTEQESRKNKFSMGLNSEEKAWVAEHFKSVSLEEIVKEIQTFFKNEGFAFSLSPGKIGSFLAFMEEKKIGFCSHYASAVAHILRAKNMKARLVAGFLGGSYNKFADFYQITQNDAHVWVEVLHQGEWKRIDPTTWIAPERMQLGGEAFMLKNAEHSFSPFKIFKSNLAWINDLNQWFIQWDFKFYQWLDEMDYSGQNALLERIKFKREWLYSFLPLLLAFFMLIYFLSLSLKKKSSSEIEMLWLLFASKMKKRGLYLELTSVAKSRLLLGQEKEETKMTFEDLVQVSFQKNQHFKFRELKRRIRRL